LKILLISDYASRAYGAENQVLALRDGLRQRGHDARLFSSSARYVPTQEPLSDYRCLGSLSPLRVLLRTFNPSAFQELRRVLAQFQPDAVHVRIFLTQLSPSVLLLLKNVPSLYHVVWHRPICPTGTKMLPDGTVCRVPAGKECYRRGCLPFYSFFPHILELGLLRRWLGAFKLIMANSEAMKRNLIAEGIPATEMIRNFVPDRLPRPPLSSPPTVAFAGQLSLEKGVEVLFSAFAKIADKIPDARLIIAGTGTKQNILKKQIADSGLSNRVSMPGYLTYHEMERQFDSAWVQAVPTRCIEAFGNVAAEAMIRGTAVIASDSGGLPEIVRHGKTGLIVPPGDEDALAQGLLHLLQNRESAEQMGMAGREFALKHLNQNDYIDKIIRLYQKLCSL